MNYRNDEPINNDEDDLLGRTPYAKQLAETLINIDASKGFCVGVYGRWGHGKTSLINIVINEIEKKLDGKANILRFNPWNFSSREELTRQFFSMLINKFKGRKDEAIGKIGNAFSNYAEALSIFNVPGLQTGGKMFGCFLKKQSIHEKGLEEQKQVLINALCEIENKIFIIIDDVDRLSNDEIKCVFQLINSVAKLPNIIYLLAFDKKIVTKAISDIQKCSGEEYLEKMIQLPIDLPPISQSQISKIILKSLDSLLLSYQNIKYNSEYWSKVYSTIVSKYILSIRDVNRLYNVLNYKLSFINDDINFCDLISLSVIESKKPKLYEWIRENKNKLIFTVYSPSSRFMEEDDKIIEENVQELTKIDPNNFEENKEIISLLFPKYKLSKYYSYSDQDDSFKELRVCNENYFDNYFSLSLGENVISNSDFNNALYNMDQLSLEKYLLEIDRENKSLFFIRKLSSERDNISNERSKILIRTFINVCEGLNSKEGGFFIISSNHLFQQEILDLLNAIDGDQEKLDILISSIKDSNANNIETISHTINAIELAYGRFFGKNGAHGNKIIPLDSLLKCEEIYISKVKSLAKDNNLLKTSRSHYLTLGLLEQMDKQFYDEYIIKLLNDDLNKIKYLCSFSRDYKSSSGNEWEYSNEYQKVLKDEDMIQLIKTSINNGQILKLDRSDMIRATAFLLIKENKTSEVGRVTEKEINKFSQSLLNK